MRTLNCRVILVDKVGLDELDREARLADATAADHDQLVVSGKLRRRHPLATHGNRARWAEGPSGARAEGQSGAAGRGGRQTLDAIASTGRGTRVDQARTMDGDGAISGDGGRKDSEAAAEGASSSVGDPRIGVDGRCFGG